MSPLLVPRCGLCGWKKVRVGPWWMCRTCDMTGLPMPESDDEEDEE